MAVVVIIIGAGFWENRLMTRMNKSISSIYKDRLVPTSGLFHINDLMYSKKIILDNYLASPATQPPAHVQQQLAGFNSRIDAIIREYETTYLVEEETRSLQGFKKKLQQYNTVEQNLIAASGRMQPAGASEKELAQLFEGIHQELVLLNDIQLQVGHELLNGSKAIKGSASVLSNLQIAVVLLITMALLQLLLLETPPLIPKNLKNFRLN
jgi:hypothetical protein